MKKVHVFFLFSYGRKMGFAQDDAVCRRKNDRIRSFMLKLYQEGYTNQYRLLKKLKYFITIILKFVILFTNTNFSNIIKWKGIMPYCPKYNKFRKRRTQNGNGRNFNEAKRHDHGTVYCIDEEMRFDRSGNACQKTNAESAYRLGFSN